MLTLFTVPKGFVGLIGTIQLNAIRSWKVSAPTSQIILFGRDEGVAEAAALLGVEHCPNLRLSACGAPLLDSVFAQAKYRAIHRTLCFVNCDIIFSGDLSPLSSMGELFLAVGESIDASICEPVRFDHPAWSSTLASTAKSRGPFALDYFFFSENLFDTMPPFRIGRARYDNWMIWRALQQKALVFDASATVGAIHQRHHYGHLRGGRNEAYRGRDALMNQMLAGLACYFYLHSIHDARYELTPEGLNRRPRYHLFFRQLWLRLTALAREIIGLQGSPSLIP